MRLVGLISGGKDSIFNMLQCISAGHEIVAVANIVPYAKEELDSYMYQSVGHQTVSLIAAALGLPLFRYKTRGKAICKSKTYVGTSDDEVEDLYHLLIKVRKDVSIEGVSVGAIASDYQRTRVENVCARLNLKCFAFLWRRNQEELLEEMITAELDAVIIKVASMGLLPEIHLGMHIRDIMPHLVSLNKKFGVNVCGEGGEYETLTLDCPLFHRFITIAEKENVVLSNDAFAPVAYLNVKNATLNPKMWETDDPVKSLQSRLNHIKSVVKDPYDYIMDCMDDVTANLFPQRPTKSAFQDLPFPFEKEDNPVRETTTNLHEYWKKSSSSQRPSSIVKVSVMPSAYLIDTTNCNLNYSTGWCAVGNITGSNLSDAFFCLQKHLERIKYEFSDAVFVNLYVRDMSDYGNMNKLYSQYMPDTLPAARVCVGTVLPPEIGVVIIFIAHKLVSKSQKVVSSTCAIDRDAMHVQSVSHWAPANIGPYSQCIRVGGMYYLSGQIPLIPGTMEILNKPIFHQCKLALRHVLRILQAMNENFTYSNVLQAICYVTSEEIALDIPSLWQYITNCVSATVTAVTVRDLPKNAQLEWEVVGCGFTAREVLEETQVIEDYNLNMKRCVYTEPFASSLVCKVSFIKKANKSQNKNQGKSLKLITSEELGKVIKNCIIFLRTDLKNIGTPLCMMKLFYKASDLGLAKLLGDIVKYSVGFKVVCTGIPVIGFEDTETFLTVTGICH